MKNIPVIIPYFTEEELQAVQEVLESGWVAQGPKVAEFERKVSEHEQVSYGVATTSCTSALHLAMVSTGISEGMDVLVPGFTFVATANSVVESGGTPVLVDVKQETFNIDPEKILHKIKDEYNGRGNSLINKTTGNKLWGIVAVHQFGMCADMGAINAIAEQYHLNVLEDAACALGAKIGDKHIGNFGNPACVSFHPRKSITTGEGGMVLTNDGTLAKKMRELRSHGSSVSADARHAGKGFLLPEFNEAGYNYRMTDIQGAIGIAQLKKLDYILEERRKKADRYNDLICKKIPELKTPSAEEGYYHTYQSYVCMLDYKKLGFQSVEEGGNFRNQILSILEEMGIATRQGTHAIHLLGYYKNRFGYEPEDLPEAFACDRLSITLPLYVQMTEEDQDMVVDRIYDLIQKNR